MPYEKLNQVLTNSQVKTCIIHQHDETLFEFNQSMINQIQKVNSITKSVISMLYGIALNRGDISHLSNSIDHYFPSVDQEKKDITLEHLLTMRSGLYWSGNAKMKNSDHWINYILNLPIVQIPGKEMKYCCANSHLLSAILQMETGMKTADYAREFLFQPMGIKDFRWDEDPQGITTGGFGLHMKPVDLLALGKLYLDGGNWNGEEILPTFWIYESTQPYTETNIGSQQYGYHWWYSPALKEKQPYFYYAAGNGGQYIFVAPTEQLITIFTGEFSRKKSVKPFQWFVRYILAKKQTY